MIFVVIAIANMKPDFNIILHFHHGQDNAAKDVEDGDDYSDADTTEDPYNCPVPDVLPDDKCLQQPRLEGPCEEYIPLWSFNQTREQCEMFIYGGCCGNENAFETVEECYECIVSYLKL